MAKQNKADTINRRTVLRNIGAATALTAGMKTASANTVEESKISNQGQELDGRTHQHLLAKYDELAGVEAELDGNVEPILEKLEDLGYLNGRSLSEFNVDFVVKDGEVLNPGDSTDGISVTTVYRNGVATAHFMITTESNGYDIGLYHQPEARNTYALVETNSETVLVRSTGENGDVSVSANCSYRTFCSDDSCCRCLLEGGYKYYYWEKEEECCEQPDGTIECTYTKVGCACDIPHPACCD